jgi:hypothetical protein
MCCKQPMYPLKGGALLLAVLLLLVGVLPGPAAAAAAPTGWLAPPLPILLLLLLLLRVVARVRKSTNAFSSLGRCMNRVLWLTCSLLRKVSSG